METFKICNHLIILSVLLTSLSSHFTALPSSPEEASDDQQGLAFPSSPSSFGGPVLSNDPPFGKPLNNQAQQPQLGYQQQQQQQQQQPSNSQQGLNQPLTGPFPSTNQQPFSSLNPQFGASGGANQNGLFTGAIPFATASGASSINRSFVQLVLVSLVTLMRMSKTIY